MNNNYYYPYDDNANFNYGCDNSNQFNYYNSNNNGQVSNFHQYPMQQQQSFTNSNYSYNNSCNNYDDSVVPTNFYENTSVNDYLMQVQQPNYNNYYTNMSQSSHYNSNGYVDQSVAVGNASNYVFNESYQTHPPCQGPQPWNYAHCYGYFGDEPCQFSNFTSVIDMEDFMNNEKRKEKSRDAARCRRSRETEIFTELANSLPIKQDEIDHLDKASVMRLSISYLKIRNMLELFPKIKNLDIPVAELENGDETDEDVKDVKIDVLRKIVEDEKFALKALDGFLLVLNAEGDITYVSQNIAEYLGLAKIDLLGQPIWDYTHACDHDELREALNGRKTSPSEVVNGAKSADCNPLLHRDMMIRLKCTLTKSGRFVNIKSASYKVIHLTGHIVFKDDGYRQLLAIGRPLAHPSNIEVPLGSSTFLTKHTLDMKFSFVDSPKMFELMGYKPEHLLGKSLYEYHHGSDSESLMSSFKCLISKGQTETNRYRFLARNGGYVWIVTQATVVFEKQKPQSVVCVSYVVSGIENEHEIYSCAQLEAQQQELSKAIETTTAVVETQSDIKVIKKDNIVLGISDLKQQQQKKLSTAEAKGISGTITNNNIKSAANNKPLTIADKKENNSDNKNTSVGQSLVTINPINTIKVNNCEIINRRPHSVTAAIFAQSTVLKSQAIATSNAIIASAAQISRKTKKQTATAGIKVFRPTQQVVANAATSVTSTIFAPRTKDMNKGYLMFAEDDTGLTMLKDEPDDLTHLAPTAGDACISLDESAPFFDMFDDFMIPDNYNTLLTDDLDSQCSKTTTTSSSSNDPFINYRDESSDVSNSPHLLSPGLSKSPGANSSIPSLCSPGSLPEDELAFMTLNMDDDLDMSMRAPYISMSESAELPLLIAEDLMWGAAPDIKQSLTINRKMEIPINVEQEQQISQQQHTESPNKQQQQQITTQNVLAKNAMDSSLASLLCSQLLQQQLLNQQQTEQQIILSKNPEIKIKILDNLIDATNELDHNTTNTKSASNVECTMNDLFQLKKQQPITKQESKEHTIVNQLQSELENSSRVKTTVNQHKRPSISCEISSKRIKAQETIKATPQLLQQLITATGVSPKGRQKIQLNHNNDENQRWKPQQQQQTQQQPASNSVLMNLLVSGCDEPLSIDPPEDLLENAESMTSPIVINDKMLSHSAVMIAPNVNHNTAHHHLSSNGMEIYQTVPNGNGRNVGTSGDAYNNFIDSDAITSILMDLNEQDYECNIAVNDILKLM
ncbi:hypothetical protein PVAND_001185 [Polypedilum vanderplanki]|uniref:Uncharacterized protein n=1 Tax=Polypedilum vanderplanki TaxID=319348 RepID=A0A9J6BM61_POLVA|nr:hypothetical protein PVAND_001185 [Polypedilum vanderplanki]